MRASNAGPLRAGVPRALIQTLREALLELAANPPAVKANRKLRRVVHEKYDEIVRLRKKKHGWDEVRAIVDPDEAMSMKTLLTYFYQERDERAAARPAARTTSARKKKTPARNAAASSRSKSRA